jgi:flagellar biosynthetic protein FlhB
MKEEDQTEVASERRLQRLAEEGNIPVGRDISAFGAFAAALLALVAMGGTLGQALVARISATFERLGEAPSPDAWVPVLALGGAVACAAAFGAAVPLLAQTQGRIWPQLAMPDLNRLWKPERLTRLATREGAADLGAALLKVAFLGLAVRWAYSGAFSQMVELIDAPQEQLVSSWLQALVPPVSKLIGALAVVGAIDFAVAHWRFRRDTMMTREELKREHREEEGDAMVKGKRKKKARELSKHRVAVDVPRADAIVVNPTHIAIAIRYRKEEGGAPRVLAKGKGALAEVIRDIARANGIAIIEDISLARLLHKRVRVGGFIPKETFKAVATVLAHVYKLKARR